MKKAYLQEVGWFVGCLPSGLGRHLGRHIVNWVTRGEKFFLVDQIYDPFAKKVRPRLVVELPGYGCAWYKASGGCTMCGFNQKLERLHQEIKIVPSDFLGLYRIAEKMSRPQRPEILYIYNGGSFLNPQEIPWSVQTVIASLVRQHPTLSGLFIESRPEFVHYQNLRSLQLVLSLKFLEIGIGLEAVTDKVRESYIRKGFSRRKYEESVRAAKNLGVQVLTYVFLKPLGLSESEAIEEAVRTIQYAFETGSDEVSLSCAFIQPETEMAREYYRDKFRPPWLWSVVEVVERTAHLGPVRIGSFEDEPPPIAIPHNCPGCSKRVMETIQDYNLVRNLGIFQNLTCVCRRKWSEETERA